LTDFLEGAKYEKTKYCVQKTQTIIFHYFSKSEWANAPLPAHPPQMMSHYFRKMLLENAIF